METIESTNVRPHAILAFDIETRGEDMIAHGIMSIGFCLGHADRFEVIQSGRISLKPIVEEFQTVEKRCMNEFWSKHPEVYKQLVDEAIQPNIGMYKLSSMLDQWDCNYDLRIVSDNPSFDLGQINFYLARYGMRPLSRNRMTGEYRNMYDSDCHARGVRALGHESAWISDKDTARELGFEIETSATHLPDDDAKHIYEMYVKTVLQSVSLRKRSSGL
jgi:hypothetical protein